MLPDFYGRSNVPSRGQEKLRFASVVPCRSGGTGATLGTSSLQATSPRRPRQTRSRVRMKPKQPRHQVCPPRLDRRTNRCPWANLVARRPQSPLQRVNGAVTALTWHSRLSRTPSSPRHSSQDRRVLPRRVRRGATISWPQPASCFAWLEGHGTRLPRREHRSCRFSLAIRGQPFEKLLGCRVRAQCAAQRGECCGKVAFV